MHRHPPIDSQALEVAYISGVHQCLRGAMVQGWKYPSQHRDSLGVTGLDAVIKSLQQLPTLQLHLLGKIST
jgi:hypothetical protein